MRYGLAATALLLACVGCGSPDEAGPGEVEESARPWHTLGATLAGCADGVDPGDRNSTVFSGDPDTVALEGPDPEIVLALTGCILDELDAPATTMAKIERTRPADGRLVETWDAYEASWTAGRSGAVEVLISKTS